jgi:hypothetical protein
VTAVTVGSEETRLVVLRGNSASGVARYALDAGFHVVVEGILYADRYGDMLGRLRADHRGGTHHYYLDVPFDETLARHATKPIADEVNETHLRDWYRPLDLLPDGVETVIGADSALAATIDRIMNDTGLCRQARQRGIPGGGSARKTARQSAQ